MKNLATIIALSLALNATAQNINQKVNHTNNQLNKVNNEIAKTQNTINNASGSIVNTQNAIDQTKQSVNKFLALLPKNNKSSDNNNVNQTKNISDNRTENSVPVQTHSSPPTTPSQQLSQSTITVSNVDYLKMKNISQALKEIAGVAIVEPSLGANTATFKVQHTGTTDALLDLLISKAGSSLRVNSFNNGIIELASK